MRGKTHSAEVKAKMSADRKGIGHPHPPGCDCKVHERVPAPREHKNAVHRDWYARNPRSKEEIRERHLFARHRMTPADYQAMWDAQDGRCCYCERPLPAEQRQVHIDHDHACTCGPKKTCASCRRGLACEACNIAIGKAGDDPDRMERMAANLRRLKAEATGRINGAAAQDELPINVVRLSRRTA
jgi:hypothetical protein